MPVPEKALIAEIRRMAEAPFGRRFRGVLTGIGDDCAVLRGPARHELLVTTDFSLEGVHFRREWHSPESIGHRCLVRGLSDIAAMGGEPVAAFLSLALPSDVSQPWVRRFIGGVMNLGEVFRVPLAGGDSAKSPGGILADIVVVGTVPKGKAILRSGARVGDRIFVTGELGGSAAAIAQMSAKPQRRLKVEDYARHFFPEPRIELGRALRETGLATAMIDTSDGLSTDLGHICEQSGVGAELEASLIPRARVGRPARDVSLDLALHGGEDYELLFTAVSGKRIPSRIAGVALTCIGRITRGKKILLRDEKAKVSELKPHGWEHFREDKSNTGQYRGYLRH